jgi:hypothetical protein
MNSGTGSSLNQLGLSEADGRLLASLWISTPEELISVSAAFATGVRGPKGVSAASISLGRACSSAQAVVPEARMKVLTNARAGGVAGCLVDPNLLDTFDRDGRVRAEAPAPTGVFQEKLPTSVNLVDRMLPVQNQGERGTCVAFATVALREFLLSDREKCSEQFLYWACKQLDGYEGAGTYVHTGMTACNRYGVCRESTWPYNGKQTDSEGQGPPPDGAIEEAKEYRLLSSRPVEPGLVIHFKHVLAGEGGRGGMPVCFAVLTFNSWFMSPETHRTGKITMPLPGEPSAGGHAWCAVGYVDNEHVPGGGYFIVRNSWGSEWASDSPEVAGHAMVPYEYIERYALEAFTGPMAESDTEPTSLPAADEQLPAEEAQAMPATQNASDAADSGGADAVVPLPENEIGAVDPKFAPYIGVLTRSKRDMEGLLLPAGTQVLVNWLDADTFVENTEPNRRALVSKDFAWTTEVRQKSWLPTVPVALGPVLDAVRSDKSKFHAAINRNLHAAKGALFPEFGLPFRFRVLPWSPKIASVEDVGNLTESVSETTRSKCGVPTELTWPQEWIDALEGISEVRIYELRTSGAVIHVLAGFITQMIFERGRTPQIAPVTQEVANAVLAEFRQWLSRSGRAKPVYTYVTLGSPCEWPGSVVGVQAGNYLTVYSSREAEGKDWTVRMPEHATAPGAVCSFLDHLRPETRDDFAQKLLELIDNELYDGNPVHVKWLYETLEREYGRESIQQAMLDLQDTGDYKLYWTRNEQLAIANLTITKEADVPGSGITAASLRPKKLFGLFGRKGS